MLVPQIFHLRRLVAVPTVRTQPTLQFLDLPLKGLNMLTNCRINALLFAKVSPNVPKKLYELLGSNASAKIGGYGLFAQTDPRTYRTEDDQWIVLLKMGSLSDDDGASALWGDAGTGSF